MKIGKKVEKPGKKEKIYDFGHKIKIGNGDQDPENAPAFKKTLHQRTYLEPLLKDTGINFVPYGPDREGYFFYRASGVLEPKQTQFEEQYANQIRQWKYIIQYFGENVKTIEIR